MPDPTHAAKAPAARPLPVETGADIPRLQNFIGGRWVDSTASEWLDVHDPARGAVIAKVPLSTGRDLDAAVTAARQAFHGWSGTPAAERARPMQAFAALLEAHLDELAHLVTTDHGKTLAEARAGIQRGIASVSAACDAASRLDGERVPHDERLESVVARQPIGVAAVVAPFTFPVMVPLWFLPFAVVCGNTFLVKPSERVPLAQQRIFQLLETCDLPPGVVNLVHGGGEVVEAICDHPGIKAVSFVGSTRVARFVYQRASHAGKRVQALGGAKQCLVVMPDADLDRDVPILVDSIYGCSGQRCRAGSVVLPVGDAHVATRERLLAAASAVRVGHGLDPAVTMGPVVSGRQREKVRGYLERGVADGASLALDGRGLEVAEHPGGYFIGPSVLDGVSPGMAIFRADIAGPIGSIAPVATLDDAIRVIERSPTASASAIFTTSRASADAFSRRAPGAIVGVNAGVADPMPCAPFGGSRDAGFSDLGVHARDIVDFYTDAKVTLSRWP